MSFLKKIFGDKTLSHEQEVLKLRVIAGSLDLETIKRAEINIEERHPVLGGGQHGTVVKIEIGRFRVSSVYYLKETREEPTDVKLFDAESETLKAFEARKLVLEKEGREREKRFFDEKEAELQSSAKHGETKQKFKDYSVEAYYEVEKEGEVSLLEKRPLMISGFPHPGIIKCPACGKFGIDVRDYFADIRGWAESQLANAKANRIFYLNKTSTVVEDCAYCKERIEVIFECLLGEKYAR